MISFFLCFFIFPLLLNARNPFEFASQSSSVKKVVHDEKEKSGWQIKEQSENKVIFEDDDGNQREVVLR